MFLREGQFLFACFPKPQLYSAGIPLIGPDGPWGIKVVLQQNHFITSAQSHTQTSFLKLPWGQKQKKKTTFKLYDLEFVGLLGTKMENEVICFGVFLLVWQTPGLRDQNSGCLAPSPPGKQLGYF